MHDGYSVIKMDATGALERRQLNLLLRLDEGALVMRDRISGQQLLIEAEAEHAERTAAKAELERLGQQLAQRDDIDQS